ncbi:MAG: NADH-quinone oxidoreductase subunit J [Anaerolineae bacterium]|nr:NADH-quinone oxidoreductase subunit J [Chloroflexota bacterium]MBN8634634.1 NADH-quinone oxidoreductase subunit J [Anaerolineae bacterium]
MLELNAQTIAFFIFALLALGGALGVVMARNLIHGALYLIVSLFGGAGFFVLLSAPFMAVVQVLVYIGAIAILIIFAVMLTRGMTRLGEIYNRQWWMSAIVGGLMFVLLALGVILPVWGENGINPNQPVSDSVATTEDLGVALVDGNQYVLPFQVASLLLTGAMIGAIVLARDTE